MELIIIRTNNPLFHSLANHALDSDLMFHPLIPLITKIFIQSAFQNFHQDFVFPQRRFVIQTNRSPRIPPLAISRLHQFIAAQRAFTRNQFVPASRPFQRRQFVPAPSSAPREDGFTRYVAEHNHNTRERAKTTNQDGGAFLRKVISEQDQAFKDQVAESDPDVFAPNGLPTLAVKGLIDSSNPLTHSNVPKFAHSQLTNLEKLRQNPSDKNLKDQISTALSRDTDFIAAMQNAAV